MTIVILGGGINKEGELSQQAKERSKRAAEIFKNHKGAKILLCGKYSFLYPKDKLPPKTEAETMRNYLLKLGVPKKNIYLETKSKDTIGNAYYAKKFYFIPRKERKATIITSEFHLERAKYIFEKVFGNNFKLTFIPVSSPFKGKEREKIIAWQKKIFKRIKEILAEMKPGDHNFLKGKLYKLKYYKEKRPAWVIEFATKGK